MIMVYFRRTFDLNRREVQAALSSRDGGIRGGPGGYGRDRQMDYDRRGIHDRDTRRDRLRRDAPRGPVSVSKLMIFECGKSLIRSRS